MTDTTDSSTPSLAALIQAARIDAAKAADGGAVGVLVGRLAREDGAASVAVLEAEGFPAHVIAAAVTTSATDKRVKPRARLGIVGDEPFVWLSTTGWQAAGKPSRRERSPSAETAEHAAAPAHLASWLNRRLAPFPGVEVAVVTGDACRAFSERVKALAWSRIQGAGDTTGEAGALTGGGLVPDALLIESFADAETYAGAWGQDPQTPEDLAEQTVALECEFSAKGEPLRWKVERWRTALYLGAAHAVVWVVQSPTVAERLQALGVGKPGERQLLVAAYDIGLGGTPFSHVGPSWWPQRLRVEGA